MHGCAWLHVAGSVPPDGCNHLAALLPQNREMWVLAASTVALKTTFDEPEHNEDIVKDLRLWGVLDVRELSA